MEKVVNLELFAENLRNVLEDIKSSKLILNEQRKIADELEDIEERMKKLKKTLLNF